MIRHVLTDAVPEANHTDGHTLHARVPAGRNHIVGEETRCRPFHKPSRLEADALIQRMLEHILHSRHYCVKNRKRFAACRLASSRPSRCEKAQLLDEIRELESTASNDQFRKARWRDRHARVGKNASWLQADRGDRMESIERHLIGQSPNSCTEHSSAGKSPPNQPHCIRHPAQQWRLVQAMVRAKG